MPVRHVFRRVATLSAAVALTGTVAALAFASPAFATGPTAGSEVPGSALPIGTATRGRSRAGRSSRSQIPADSTATPVQWGFHEVVARGPRWVAPTMSSACDGNTIQGDSIFAASNGSVSYTNVAPNHGYTVYVLPDATLGSPPATRRCAT